MSLKLKMLLRFGKNIIYVAVELKVLNIGLFINERFESIFSHSLIVKNLRTFPMARYIGLQTGS